MVVADVPDSPDPQRLLPIHATGVVVPKIDSVTEALRLGGLDWKVGTRAVGVFNPDTDMWHPEAGYQATYRMDTGDTLGIVGAKYHVVGNDDSFAPIQPMVDEGRLVIEAVGALRGGRIPFLVAALPDASVEIAGEPFDTRLLLMTSHDGSHMLKGVTWPTRFYCLNIIAPAFGRGSANTGKIRFRHTRGGMLNQADRTRTITVAMEYTARLAQYGEQMATRPMGAKAFETFLRHLMPNPRGEDEETAKQVEDRRAVVRSLFTTSPNLENIRGTDWAAYKAVAEYTDYYMASRDTRLGDRVENKAMSIIDGQGAILKQAAWDLLVGRKPGPGARAARRN
jgi:phage/plasmid-like protein (TIGR03299 family)